MVKLGPTIIEQVSKLCAGSGVARLDLTGSAVHDDFDPSTSDIDLLVEFLPGAQVSAPSVTTTRKRRFGMSKPGLLGFRCS